MSDNSASGFGAFVPGFDFLQGLVKSAAQGATGGAPQGAPDWSKWVAPTLQADEIDKRIGELKTVQFWLEQNARALAATIQALEVQKMTLATLRGMNVQVNDLASAFGFTQGGKPAAERGTGSGPYDDMYTRRDNDPAPAASPAPAPSPAQPEASAPGQTEAASAAPTAVDPLQWWNALAGQFQQIAAGAMQEAAEQARANPVGLQEAARQAFDAAGRMAAEVAQAAVKAAPPAPARKRTAAKATPKTAKTAKTAKKAVARKTAPAKPAAVRKPAVRKTASRTR